MAAFTYNVFVGSEIGYLKGVDTTKETFTNWAAESFITKNDEITAMAWSDTSENKIYTGHRNHTVRVFDSDKHTFLEAHNCQNKTGSITGLFCLNGNVVTAVESGFVKLFNEDQGVEINTHGKLSKMRSNYLKPQEIATGGEENDLKIWDLNKPDAPTFKAKNVQNDFLDLRVPVWITDIQYKSDGKLVTCSRHHQIRVYDPKAQRRPVVDIEFEKYPLMCLSVAHNAHQVIVGSSRGRMALVDLRKQKLVHVFKGFAGGVRGVHCHPTLPIVASCGLDRFLRIHHLSTHQLLHKIYLKTRLNCLLMKTNYQTLNQQQEAIENDDDDLWNSMTVVKEKSTENRPHKKLKSLL